MSNERVIVFIDGSNFYHGCRRAFGHTRVDIARLCAELTGSRDLVAIRYYNTPVALPTNSPQYIGQQKFFNRLKTIPKLTLFLGHMIRVGGDFYEKGVDVLIAVHLIHEAFRNSYDTAILVSADGDFAPAVRAVQDLGKVVENAYFAALKSFHLFQTCNRFIDIDAALFDRVRLP